jgi:hypothetical protein
MSCVLCQQVDCFSLKMTFYSKSTPVKGATGGVGFTFDAKERFCRDHAHLYITDSKLALKTWVGATIRQQIANFMHGNALGEPDWNATVLDFVEDGKPSDNYRYVELKT